MEVSPIFFYLPLFKSHSPESVSWELGLLLLAFQREKG